MSVVERGYVDQGSKVEGGADECVGMRRRRDVPEAAESAAENAVVQMYAAAAVVVEDETLGAQRTELGSAQRRMGLDAVGVGGVVGDLLGTVKRDRLARMTTWSGHY